MENKLKLIVNTFGKEKFKQNEPISDHTALKVGGPAKLFFVAVTQREIFRIVTETRKLKIPLLIFGTGSKMMISDNGFDGLIIKNRSKNISVVGASISLLIDFLNGQNLQVEDIQGLPGTLGGNLFINSNLQNKVKTIKVINQYSEIEEINAKELSLRKHIILSAVLKFKARI